MKGKCYHRFLWPKWPSPNNEFDYCQLVYIGLDVVQVLGMSTEYAYTHTHKHFKCLHCSIESFVPGQSHVECMHSVRIAGWRTSWNQIEYIETNQNKTKQTKKKPEDPNKFNVEVLLNVIEFYCVCESIHVCIAACAHPSMQTPDEKCKCGAISKWIAVNDLWLQ